MKRKKVVLLGATGSIGESAIRVLRALPERFELYGVAARSSLERLAAQAAEFGSSYLLSTDPAAGPRLRALAPPGCRALVGEEALLELVARPEVEVVLVAIVGTGGLLPTLAALRSGKRVALASKEVMVLAGELVRRELASTPGAEIIPVDSEHSALFQCLQGRRPEEVAKLVLTASGGAFREWPRARLAEATAAAALKHPTWSMGPKVTIDSASLMNKALELVEARYLFGVGPEQLGVVIHPESVVHSLVELSDGALLAQLSRPDMRFAIQYALTYPERVAGELPRLDFRTRLGLSFQEPEPGRYPALELAAQALRGGGTLPAVMNAANEVAVELFRRDELRFPAICELVGRVMGEHRNGPQSGLEEIVAVDAWARRRARELATAPGAKF